MVLKQYRLKDLFQMRDKLDAAQLLDELERRFDERELIQIDELTGFDVEWYIEENASYNELQSIAMACKRELLDESDSPSF